MKHLLTESYRTTKRLTGADPRSPQGFKRIISDQNAAKTYIRSLSEGLSSEQAEEFTMLAENTRLSLLENSMFQLNPYETMTLPVLRKFYPRLIAKELVNVMPIDAPDVIKAFIKASFKKHGEPTFGHEFPSNDNVSRGPSVGITVTKTANQGTTDVLAEAGLTPSQSHIEKDFVITGVTDSTSNFANVRISPTVDGNFSDSVNVLGTTDVISGHVDFLNGTLTWSSANGEITSINYQAVCSLEENQVNPSMKFTQEKIRLTVVDRRISAEYSINMEQDVKALFDISLQSEIINIIGEQIALDIDREIVLNLISANNALNPTSHTQEFDITPPTSFTWGPKMWYENILPPLNELSAQVYNDSLMGAANTIACNPLDASIFESINGFAYSGTAFEGGELGYRKAEMVGGKWKVLVSSVVPQGDVILQYRSDDAARACYIFAPYVPSVLTPYPLGANPSLTIMSRYAKKLIRPEGIAVLKIKKT